MAVVYFLAVPAEGTVKYSETGLIQGVFSVNLKQPLNNPEVEKKIWGQTQTHRTAQSSLNFDVEVRARARASARARARARAKLPHVKNSGGGKPPEFLT